MCKSLAVLPLGMTLLLGACQTTPPPLPDSAHHRAEALLGQMPAWITTPPTTEGGWLYAAGTDQSSDAQFAVDRALLAAARSLAFQETTHLAATSRDFITESGASGHRQQNGQADRATRMSVSVQLPAYTITHTKIVVAGSQFRAYVLIRSARPDADAGDAEDNSADDTTKAKAKTDDETRSAAANKALDALDEAPPPAAAPRPPVTTAPLSTPSAQGGAT